MTVYPHLRLAQTAAVNDARMVQTVAQDHVPLPCYCGNNTGIGRVSGVEDQSRLRTLKKSKPVLEFAMHRTRPRNKPRCACPKAIALHRLHGGLTQCWMIGKTQIVVRAQQQHLPAFYHNTR